MPLDIRQQPRAPVHRVEQRCQRKIDVFAVGLDFHAHAFGNHIEDFQGNDEGVVMAESLIAPRVRLSQLIQRAGMQQHT